jgi:hypothetical protein
VANTIIQFKRSSNTTIPPNGALAAGQPGYSFLSEQLFLGNSTGNGILTVGGNVFVQKVSAAASANGSNTLVMRDLSGDFTARHITATRFIGGATSANTLTTSRYIASGGEISGNVAFDGSTNINLALALATTGVGAGTYGSATLIPVIVVDSKGRITAASNVAAAGGGGGNTAYTVYGNTGSNLATGNTNLVFYGNGGVTTAVTSNTGNTIVTIAVDSTFVRTVGDQTIAGEKTFSGNVTIGGGLTVSGNTTIINTTDLQVGDNQIILNADLPIGSAPTEDAGLIVNRGNTNSNAEISWDETNDYWYATGNNLATTYKTLGRIHTDGYANATSLTTGTVPTARIAGSYTGITGLGIITVGTWQGTNVAVAYGGTGRATHTLNGVLYGNTTGDLIATSAPTEGKVLQGSAAGVPVFGDIDGGFF